MQHAIADYFKTQPVVKAWLFGSFARGEETPLSDVDILVVRVDLVTEGSLADFARESVERDKILIYERAA